MKKVTSEGWLYTIDPSVTSRDKCMECIDPPSHHCPIISSILPLLSRGRAPIHGSGPSLHPPTNFPLTNTAGTLRCLYLLRISARTFSPSVVRGENGGVQAFVFEVFGAIRSIVSFGIVRALRKVSWGVYKAIK